MKWFDTLVVAGRDVHWLMHGKSTDTKLMREHIEELARRYRAVGAY